MAKVILRQKAIDDLNRIWRYTYQNWSIRQAEKYYSNIKMACKSIGDNPQIGKPYFNIKQDLLGFKSAKHIVFYRIISNDEVEVVRILHAQMDLVRRINEQ